MKRFLENYFLYNFLYRVNVFLSDVIKLDLFRSYPKPAEIIDKLPSVIDYINLFFFFFLLLTVHHKIHKISNFSKVLFDNNC